MEKTDGTHVSKGGLYEESAGSPHDVTKRQVFSIENIAILQTPHDATDNSLISSFSSTSNGDGLRVGCLGASETPAIGFRVSDLHAKATGKIGKVKHISTKDHYRKLRLVLISVLEQEQIHVSIAMREECLMLHPRPQDYLVSRHSDRQSTVRYTFILAYDPRIRSRASNDSRLFQRSVHTLYERPMSYPALSFDASATATALFPLLAVFEHSSVHQSLFHGAAAVVMGVLLYLYVGSLKTISH
jgi:hypothetical protein